MERDVARMGTLKRGIVLGGADCLHADLAAARALFIPDVIIATNNAGRDYPDKFDHWVTMHPDKLKTWVAERREKGLPDARQLWCPRHRTPPPGIECLTAPSWGGSSGLFGIVVGLLAVELHKIVLVGCPMLAANAHYDDKRVWAEASRYHSAWQRYLPEIKYKVRSMSGWTKELLGAPDRSWLDA